MIAHPRLARAPSLPERHDFAGWQKILSFCLSFFLSFFLSFLAVISVSCLDYVYTPSEGARQKQSEVGLISATFFLLRWGGTGVGKGARYRRLLRSPSTVRLAFLSDVAARCCCDGEARVVSLVAAAAARAHKTFKSKARTRRAGRHARTGRGRRCLEPRRAASRPKP